MEKTTYANPPALAYTMKQFCQVYQISRSKVYEFMNSGELAYVMVGNRRRISVEAARRWFDTLPTKEASRYG